MTKGAPCEWKRRVSSWAEGEAIVERIIGENIAAGEPSKSIGLAVYRCAPCGAFHVGHSGAQRGRRVVRRAQRALTMEQSQYAGARWLWRRA